MVHSWLSWFFGFVMVYWNRGEPVLMTLKDKKIREIRRAVHSLESRIAGLKRIRNTYQIRILALKWQIEELEREK